MKWLLVTFLFLCFVLLKSDAVDQVDALRSTLKTLCDYNKNGAFGNCCLASNNGESVTLDNPGCFLSEVDVDVDGTIDWLFVLFSLYRCFSFSFFFQRLW